MPGRVLGKQKSEQWQGMYACRCGRHLLIAWLALLAAAVAARDLNADGEQCAVAGLCVPRPDQRYNNTA